MCEGIRNGRRVSWRTEKIKVAIKYRARLGGTTGKNDDG
jgi:hypothetical protein